MVLKGKRDLGFDVEKTKGRLADALEKEGIDGDSVSGSSAFPHPLLDHTRDVHRSGMPVPGCRACGLLHAHWRLCLYERGAKPTDPQITLARAAQQAHKLIREAHRTIEGPWRDFEPVALAQHKEWKNYPSFRRIAPHNHKLICLDVPKVLKTLENASVILERLTGINTNLSEPEIAQPLGKKPFGRLLFDVETTLHEAGLRDKEIVAIVREGGEKGRIARTRTRRNAAKKKPNKKKR
jgi:hypothetical protein